MSNSYFQFKEFRIRQDRCAMKVGTDGVLLGSWAAVSSCVNILDIGTGTGLIALMAAQRSEASIDAIEIDANACGQASENVRQSPYSGRIRVYHQDFRSFTMDNTQRQYDHIVSNPPFFNDSLKSPDPSRTTARHTLSLSLEELISSSVPLLTTDGSLSLILPAEQQERITGIISRNNLYLNRLTYVYPKPDTLPRRILIEAGKTRQETVTGRLTIEKERHLYTDEYIALTRAFYLKM